MLPLTRLLDTDLWAIETNAESAELRGMHSDRSYILLSFYGERDAIALPENKNFEILGTVDKDSISFDVEDYVVCISRPIGIWKNYNDVPVYQEYQFKTAKESFYSILSASGIEFSNKLDSQKEGYLLKGSENSWGKEELQQWQQLEDKVVKNKLLILKQL